MVTASADPADVEKAFRVMEAGAVAILEKPHGPGNPRHLAMASKLVQTVRAMSEVRVIKRWARRAASAASKPLEPAIAASDTLTKIELVAIGASTGGPLVLQTILAGFSRDFPVPILIVQHIAAGFVGGFVEWLARTVSLPVHIAANGARMLAGHVYIAPDGQHMGVEQNGRVSLVTAPAENGLRPAVSWLFRSVAENFGPRAAGILLTGMGADGAAELRLMRDRGALTIAQDRESCVVFGMPGEAVKLDAAVHVLPPQRIVATLDAIVRSSHASGSPRDHAAA